VEVLDGDGLPIYTWAPRLEAGALAQARHCSSLSVAYHHVAVMADGHQGYGVPIGAVLALDDAVAPYAVGNDIGCGVAAVPTTVGRAALLAVDPRADRSARDTVMRSIQGSVPAGAAAHRDPGRHDDVEHLLESAFEALDDAAAASKLRLTRSAASDAGGRDLTRSAFFDRGRAQAGTLGSGNHFIELLADPEERVWIMLHSGSRGIGSLVCANFHRMARAACLQAGVALADPGLAFLPVGAGDDRWARVGHAYERALGAALRYAERNRQRMLEVVAAILERRFPRSVRWDEAINIHHNDATRERHFGREVWVHRKGAVKAAAGDPTIIPGSMGTGSYLGRGLGNPDSFASCSHGAGRSLSRGQARRQLSLRDELGRVAAAGGKVFTAYEEGVLDEMPSAYKDLDAVMAAQADLVEPVQRLTPLATYKGADPPRRGAGRTRRR
jgi:tRNA-splicing ligase RtcB